MQNTNFHFSFKLPPAELDKVNIGKLKDGESYSWHRVKGESMTDKDNKLSIPTGSTLLCREVDWNEDAFNLPLNTPVILMGLNKNNEVVSICKTITFIDMAFKNSVKLTSYNKDVPPFWLPLNFIEKVFIVDQILKPGRKTTIKIYN